jgi:hypothetical protein
MRLNLLKEPLLHFLLIGAGLFLLYGWENGPAAVPGGPAATPSTQVNISWDTVERMSRQFELTWQRPPTEADRQSLIEEIVRNEIFYREAIAIGLDRDDEILKRRLRQKMEFIYEDIATIAEPTDEELHIFLSRYRQKYLADPRLAFQQLYFHADKRGMNAEADAIKGLAQLREGASPDSVGDPTQLAAEVPLTPSWEIERQFGEAFSTRLLEFETGVWAGPLQSAYGWHLVLIHERIGGHLPDLNEIRETVKQDWLVERQQELKDAAYAKVREKYAVTIEKPRTVTAAGNAAGTEVTTQ